MMPSTKRDVDRHVQQLESKILAESERNLKALSVARLYINVGDYESAKKYLGRYLSVRDNSSVAHLALGQTFEGLRQPFKALESYRRAFELDPSKTEAVAKVVQLLVAQGEENIDKGRARYWLEKAESLFPRDPHVTDLRNILASSSDAAGTNGRSKLNGNGAASAGVSADGSPEEVPRGNHEDSLLWSAGAGSNVSILNGSRREFSAAGGVGTPSRVNASILADRDTSTSTPRRFVPRPSPERLAAQIQGLEATQERVTELMAAQGRQMADEFKQHSVMMVDEMRAHRMAALEEMKAHRQNVTDLKMDMKQGLHDIKVEVAKLSMTVKEASQQAVRLQQQQQGSTSPVKATVDPALHREIRDALANLPRQLAAALPPPPPAPQPSTAPPTAAGVGAAPKGISLSDMQEALAQQTALLQMGGFGFAAGMFSRPPVPPQPHLPPPGAAAIPHQPPLPQHPLPPQQQQQQQQQQPWMPPAGVQPPPPPAEAAKPTQPPPPAAAVAPPSNIAASPASPKLHEYQINLPKVPPVADPFEGQEGPAVPVVTTALLSNIPSPAFSSLAKTPPSNKPSPAAAVAKPQPTAAPAAPASSKPASAAQPAASKSLFDKFKPKAGSWECPGCFIRNEADVICCPSCETAKPGHEEEVKKMKEAKQAAKQAEKPKITFGAGGGFKFGVQPAAAATTAAAPPTVSSTTTDDGKPSPFAGFSFGAQPSAAGSGFSFQVPKGGGSPAASGQAQTKTEDADHLSFDGQGLKLNAAADAEPVAKTIREFKAMKKLTFSGNTVGIEAAEVIGQALAAHPEFEQAHWKDMFTGRMKSEIPPALKHLGRGIMAANAKLTVLDLSDNAFGPIGVEGIVDLLKSPSCFTLQELKLNNTGCGVTGGTKLAKTLLEAYDASAKAGKPMGLRVFVLGRSRQENDGATELAKVFKKMGTLREVVMPQNGIYQQGIKALADAFCANPELRVINMNDNTFTPLGAQHMAAALKKLTKLTHLNLGDCLLKTEGASTIAKSLEGSAHRELEELRVDCNEIRVEGGRDIVNAVKDKPKMTLLNLDGNQFGEKGCEELKALLGAKSSVLPGESGEIEDDEGDSSDEEDNDDEGDGDEDDGDDEDNDDDAGQTPKPAAAPAPATGIFGALASAASATPAFSFTTSTSSSIFGNAGAGSGTVFGSAGTDSKNTSIFGTPASTSSPATSIFGTPAAAPKPEGSGSSGLDLSANKSLSSFAALASKSNDGGFAFGNNSSSSFSFGGAGSALFKTASPAKPDGGGADNADESAHAEDDGHDPHFEPIIPLPELVQVKTGEEDEEVLFKHRAKVYRYDVDTKQWKERGVGDIKILQQKNKNVFRVLLRREQIHKIACNHLINTEMELKPMSSSETAVCWFAMDYADEEAKLEHLAVRFKLADTLNDFKKVFHECQEKLASGESGNNESAAGPAGPGAGGSGSGPGSSGNDKAKEPESSDSNKKDPGLDLSANKSLSSFAALASKNNEGGFAFGNTSNSSFSFGGAGSSLFKTSPAKAEAPAANADESANPEDDGHDPHFEPIIPLPELVEVKTGEEDEEVLFKHRAKVYRYDVDTKQWKERGVGDIKILKQKNKSVFRVLLRREQIHKIACNHLISTEMELKPMSSSETAVCWFAMDYAEEEAKLEHLAVRFKLADTLNDFKKVFQECQEKLKTAPQPSPQGEDSQEDTDENGEEDEDEENIMYERECKLEEVKDDGSANPLGEVLLKIVYDDDVYGARIVAHSGSDEEEIVCNHLIAIQTALEESQDGRCMWSALDFSRDPPSYRKFRATFGNAEDEQEFRDTFYEGKELADQSEILELPEGANPETYYYGQGGDYDEESGKQQS